MTIYQHKADIVGSEKLGEGIYRFTVKSPDIAAATRPGQFVMIRVSTGLDPLLRRPFSVHQVAGNGLIQILFKVVGKGTCNLAEMEAGRQLDILGPLGRGFSSGTAQQHCLVGGGIGIAPLLFLADKLLENNEPAALSILLGARTGDEIAVLAEDFAGRGLKVQCTTEDGSMGKQGLVTELMPGPVNGTVRVYSCGPHPMLRAVVDMCRKKGWSCQVSLETIMACGLGACVGCTVSRADLQGYVHVCKDGPVFAAEELAWF